MNSFTRLCASNQEHRANEGGAPVGTYRLGHCREAERRSRENAESSRDKRTEARVEAALESSAIYISNQSTRSV
jgi:hypothetical protein